ncbi:4'-phosphopantetheinyl transferase family protein [Nocardioides sp.]|uniref:4'-phosphopantetheinyl transferase family protein n=1 Tax=Nocardioides sp. TaxID=35761 RepID=UPI0039E434F5
MSVLRFAAVSAGEYDAGWLTEVERARHDRLRLPADRAAYLAAHVLVRAAAAELLGADPAELVLEQRCPDCERTDHGRPAIAGTGLHVSLSHTRGWVAAAAAERPVGIDVERIRPVSPGVVARMLTESEQEWLWRQPDADRAFTRLWVRKEALVKAGAGRLADAGRLDVLAGGEPAVRIADRELVEWTDGDAVGCWAN